MECIITKRCGKCKKEKNITEFYKDRSAHDGFCTICKICDREKNRAYYKRNIIERHETHKKYREANREKLRNYLRTWQNNNRDKVRGYVKKWTENNIDHAKEQQRLWRENNKERIKIKTKKWAENNPYKRRLTAEKRRAAKQHAGGVITKKEWKEILSKYNHTCLCCRRNDVRLTMDHVVPLSEGGKHIIDNIQPLCGPCNSKKHTKIIDYR